MMTDKIISAHDLSCMSGSQYLLKNINWEVARGERWVVFGRNGCGKTTLLSTIAGYNRYSYGELRVFGEKYEAENILRLRQRIGWISGSFFEKNYRRESVLDIVLAGVCGTLGTGFDINDQYIARARSLLSEFGLKEKIHAPFDLLSKGERQHVLIARAFLTEPEILILDEPCAGLDVLAREKLLDAITYLADNSQTTLIYVTHYPEEVLPVFDHCLLLRYGTVYQKGRLEEIFTTEVMADFLNHPLEVSLHDGRYQLFLKPAPQSVGKGGEQNG